MKKVKLFLTVSSLCLAIPAIAGNKASGRFIPIAYTEDPITGTCTVASGIDCTGIRIPCLDENGNQLYAFNNNATCSVLLYQQ